MRPATATIKARLLCMLPLRRMDSTVGELYAPRQPRVNGNWQIRNMVCLNRRRVVRIPPRSRAGRAILVLVAALSPALAHHSIAAYDLVHGTIIQGLVTGFFFGNPHSQIRMNVAGENETVEDWSIEMESATLLRRLGWNKQTLKPGDRVTVMGGRAKDGSFHLRAVWVELPDGRKLPGLPPPEQ